MDASVKIPEEGVMLLEELKIDLRRMGVRVSQKQLINEGILLLVKNKSELSKRLNKKDNTKEMVDKFLTHEKFDFGPNWMEEIDTTL